LSISACAAGAALSSLTAQATIASGARGSIGALISTIVRFMTTGRRATYAAISTSAAR
jgi:hypothetical protein